MYPKIQRRQVIMNVLHPGCARSPRWSPPVLWRRIEDGLASICVLIHSCKMPKESETTEVNAYREREYAWVVWSAFWLLVNVANVYYMVCVVVDVLSLSLLFGCCSVVYSLQTSFSLARHQQDLQAWLRSVLLNPFCHCTLYRISRIRAYSLVPACDEVASARA